MSEALSRPAERLGEDLPARLATQPALLDAESHPQTAEGLVLQLPAPPIGAPATLEAGEKATFVSTDIFTVSTQDADHPIFVASYMTGLAFDGGPTVAWSMGGDPDFVNVVPSDQFLDRYVFFVDYTYSHTTLTVVRKRTANGFAPVVLDCAGPLTDFPPLGTSGEYEFTWVRLTDLFAPATGTCDYGRHEATSDGRFSLTV